MSRKKPHHGNRRRGSGRGHPEHRRELEGTLVVSRPGVAHVETPEGDFDLVRNGMREAMNGDTVRIVLVEGRGTSARALVSSVVERAVTTFLGSYGLAGPLGVVTPLDERLGRDFFVVPEDMSPESLGVVEGDVVQARIVEYPTRSSSAVVTLERRVGDAEDLDLNIEAIVASYGLAGEFSSAVKEEVAGLEPDVAAALATDARRRDLRETLCVTIDPIDARDFDDAVSARRLDDGGFELGVHIADVTYYVKPGSSVDAEARRRTTSTYLVDRVIPMLPEELCCDVCSLRPGEDRLTMSVIMHLDERGEIVSAKMMSSAIRSRARLNYDVVEAVLEGTAGAESLDCVGAQPDEVAELLHVMDEIRALREEVRRRRGAIDFETVEPKVMLDEDGHPTGVNIRTRTHATGLIEEAMLLANECVAKRLADVEAPAAYRVHDRPAPDDLKRCVQPLRELGLLGPGDASALTSGDPFAVQDVLERAKGTDAAPLASALLLRAQRKAVYAPANEGHYALGAEAYCHFTSPIRRYPDVLVHRALKALLAGKLESKEMHKQERELPQLCVTCSERERAADAAARASQKVKMAELLSAHIGEEFDGVVSGCTSYGVFVTLGDLAAEGLLPVRSLGDEWFDYDEVRMSLVGEETGEVWGLGRRVRVVVTSTNVARGYIDLGLPARLGKKSAR